MSQPQEVKYTLELPASHIQFIHDVLSNTPLKAIHTLPVLAQIEKQVQEQQVADNENAFK